ncbi:MAG: HAMP domain-containing histidine kinase [Lachnospiraceae bacterium]|nr:HAMP domain-containing histidine kinase [Lachnospiraceae bacterium]MBQ9936360.1 HAMP domain-containing histidine kinase [Lachnospiraceae bacterium]
MWNGMFVEWFENKFIEYSEEWFYNADVTMCYTSRIIKWGELKTFILGLSVAVGVVLMAISMIYSNIVINVKTKNKVSELSEMIKRYMSGKEQSVDLFPVEYSEISTQMAEVKMNLQMHEQLLKDEVGRKNDLVAYLAHDLKTPLTSVVGYLSLLNEAQDMPKDMQEKYIDITLRKALRLEELINEFFEITRYNMMQITVEKEKIDLSYMLYQMADEFYPQLQKKGNTVKLDIDENIFINGDSNKLARVFNNILKNAIAYSYENTEINISTNLCDNGVEVRISNNGRTISVKKLETIFDKFVRLDEARGLSTGGAGLGLAIAREIVNLHGGRISATSQDELTTFTVFIPDLVKS